MLTLKTPRTVGSTAVPATATRLGLEVLSIARRLDMRPQALMDGLRGLLEEVSPKTTRRAARRVT